MAPSLVGTALIKSISNTLHTMVQTNKMKYSMMCSYKKLTHRIVKLLTICTQFLFIFLS